MTHEEGFQRRAYSSLPPLAPVVAPSTCPAWVVWGIRLEGSEVAVGGLVGVGMTGLVGVRGERETGATCAKDRAARAEVMPACSQR